MPFSFIEQQGFLLIIEHGYSLRNVFEHKEEDMGLFYKELVRGHSMEKEKK